MKDDIKLVSGVGNGANVANGVTVRNADVEDGEHVLPFVIPDETEDAQTANF